MQTPHEIDDLLAEQLIGRSIRQLQVLGVNSLRQSRPLLLSLSVSRWSAFVVRGESLPSRPPLMRSAWIYSEPDE